MMVRIHLNPPNKNDKQFLEKPCNCKNLAKVDIFQFLLS